ncbi:hypothetical protein LINPERPRIM_LOCUS37945, partial [Linum perenne]
RFFSSVPYPLFSENSFLTILALLAVEIRPASFSNQLNLHDSIRRNSRHHYCRGTHHLRRKSPHLCASLSLFSFRCFTVLILNHHQLILLQNSGVVVNSTES